MGEGTASGGAGARKGRTMPFEEDYMEALAKMCERSFIGKPGKRAGERAAVAIRALAGPPTAPRDTTLHGCGAPTWVCDRIGCAAVLELLGCNNAPGMGQESGLRRARGLVAAEQLEDPNEDNDGDCAYRQAVNDCLGAIDAAIANLGRGEERGR